MIKALLGLILIGCSSLFAEKNIGADVKVRAITAFVKLDAGQYRGQIAEGVDVLARARDSFQKHGFEVETIRIATQAFPEYTAGMTPDQAMSLFRALDHIGNSKHVLIAIGPAMEHDKDNPASADFLGEVLAETKLEGSVIIAAEDGIHWNAIRASTRVIKYLSEHTERSEGNFRFAATSFVPSTTPFFPAARSSGKGHSFSIGLEGASIVLKALSGIHDPRVAEGALSNALDEHLEKIEAVANQIARDTGWEYEGIDVSPAPLAKVSIGAAIEEFTARPVGSSGTLTAAALITTALRATPVKRAGYSGLMLPVLEDERLAQRWSEGALSLDSLLSYSAVCGTGLDVVPLPGNISDNQLDAILGDVASLSYKWRKPLSARLLPVAGKKAGDRTEFTDPVLTNVVLQPITPSVR